MVTAKAIIGLMINDSSSLQCLAFRHREEPRLNQTDDRVGFSVGHYSGGETLLNIQPTGSPRDLLLSDVFPKQGAQLLLAQASMSSGALKRSTPESVARWRNWLLVCDGQFNWGDKRAEILDSLPLFLGRIAAHGDEELLFGQFLAGLYEIRLVNLQARLQKLAI